MCLTFRDQILKHEDTPASLDYQITDFIYGRVYRLDQITSSSKNSDEIEVKFQSNKFKKPIIIMAKRKESFKVALIKCAEELNTKPNNIQLKFDGEIIDLKQTPENFDFEGGELIDIILSD